MSVRILMLAPHPHIRTPLRKHTPVLAAALRELGCSVRVEAWGRRREHEGRAAKIAGRAADVRRIRRILDAERFDVLIVKTAHDWKTLSRDIALLIAIRGRYHRCVLQLHGSRLDRLVTPGHTAFKLASALLARLHDAVLVLSREEQRQWQTFYPAGRAYLVKNPLRRWPSASAMSRQDLGVPDGVPIVLFTGRLIEAKGAGDLIAALPAVLARMPCHLLLAGEGAAAQELERRAAALGLASRVTLAGYLEDDPLQAAYECADLFALPTRADSFPFVILEAMAAGLPMVTTRIRGMADHLREGVNALFVPPCDPAALGTAVTRLLSDSALRARMRRANQEKVREFAPEIVGREYFAVLREIADAQPRSGR